MKNFILSLSMMGAFLFCTPLLAMSTLSDDEDPGPGSHSLAGASADAAANSDDIRHQGLSLEALVPAILRSKYLQSGDRYMFRLDPDVWYIQREAHAFFVSRRPKSGQIGYTGLKLDEIERIPHVTGKFKERFKYTLSYQMRYTSEVKQFEFHITRFVEEASRV